MADRLQRRQPESRESGSDELPELKRQSREYAAAWTAHGLPGEMIEVPGCDHYAVLEQLAQPDGVLANALAVSAHRRI
jgi:arylformamidase